MDILVDRIGRYAKMKTFTVSPDGAALHLINVCCKLMNVCTNLKSLNYQVVIVVLLVSTLDCSSAFIHI